jgi:hypothetical protein
MAVIIPPGELVEIEREVILRHLVEGADDPALQERPERIDVRRMDVPAHVLPLEWHGLVRVVVGAGAYARRSPRRPRAASSTKRERVSSSARWIFQRATFPRARAHDGHFALLAHETLALRAVLVRFLAADVRLVDLDLAGGTATPKIPPSLIGAERNMRRAVL